MLQTRPAFQMTLTVPQIQDLGSTPLGGRRIATVTGGHFEGERLRGKVLGSPAGDWLLQRNDGVLCLDVRLTLQTDDGALIFMAYKGMRHGPADVLERLGRGEAVDPASYYMRATPVFETASAPHAWLNRAVFVSMGRREAAGPVYDVFEVL
ncbi:MAG: hypothetical protein RLZZ126_885 [Pseudomonadota bacterium]|jgi:hypothetical protein